MILYVCNTCILGLRKIWDFFLWGKCWVFWFFLFFFFFVLVGRMCFSGYPVQTDYTGNWPLVPWEQNSEREEKRKKGRKIFWLNQKNQGGRGVGNENDCLQSCGSFSTLAQKMIFILYVLLYMFEKYTVYLAYIPFKFT